MRKIANWMLFEIVLLLIGFFSIISSFEFKKRFPCISLLGNLTVHFFLNGPSKLWGNGKTWPYCWPHEASEKRVRVFWGSQFVLMVISIYIIIKSMRALWLVNQLWVIVTINPRKNRASSELLYKSNIPQVSMVYKLINHLGCW